MLKKIYKFVTPWAISNKTEILKNRVLGKITNFIYPVYCKTRIKNDKSYINEDVIVSLTSYPLRMHSVYYTLNSIIRQNVKPQKIILWLAETQFPNKESDVDKRIRNLMKYGLEIKFCEDLKSYKKIFFTAKNYKNKIIVTADDDVLYPEDWLENLIAEHQKFKDKVICYRAHEMKIKNNKILPYKEWNGFAKNVKGPSDNLVATGVGGILYPANFFDEVDLNSDVIMELAPTTDDIWLKVIAMKKNIQVVKVFENSKEWFTVNSSQKESLRSVNVDNSFANDIALEKLISYYEIMISDNNER